MYKIFSDYPVILFLLCVIFNHMICLQYLILPFFPDLHFIYTIINDVDRYYISIV